ncbi:MAG: hypothetical protein KFH87_13980 [Bacteroidetes bacterium]|nr:hypothetical protein [Bacteroidota bacterium]
MDRQEFEVTVREAFEDIDRAIETLALDGVEAYPVDAGLRLQFDDGSFIQLMRNDAQSQIDVQQDTNVVPFYFDDIEEQWFSRKDERSLTDILSEEIGKRISRTIRFPDEL